MPLLTSTLTLSTQKAMASASGFYRSAGVAADLGGAMVSSITDPIMSMVTAGKIGMSPLGTFVSQIDVIGRRIFKGMSVSEKEMFAQRIGIVNFICSFSLSRRRPYEGGFVAKIKIQFPF